MVERNPISPPVVVEEASSEAGEAPVIAQKNPEEVSEAEDVEGVAGELLEITRGDVQRQGRR